GRSLIGNADSLSTVAILLLYLSVYDRTYGFLRDSAGKAHEGYEHKTNTSQLDIAQYTCDESGIGVLSFPSDEFRQSMLLFILGVCHWLLRGIFPNRLIIRPLPFIPPYQSWIKTPSFHWEALRPLI